MANGSFVSLNSTRESRAEVKNHFRQRKGSKNMKNVYLEVEGTCKRVSLTMGQRMQGWWGLRVDELGVWVE